MEKENILQTYWGYVYGYFTLRGARKVFFFSLLAIFVAALMVNFWGTDISYKILFAACAVCVLSTLVDSFQVKSEFLSEISNIELGPGDEFLVKKKRRDLNYGITIKFVFLAIFLVLLFQGV